MNKCINWLIFCFTALITSFLPSMSIAADATVTVNTQKRLQTMDGWGQNDMWNWYRTDRGCYFDPTLTGCIKADISLTIQSCAANFAGWEPSNDNSDPNSFNWSAFNNFQNVPKFFGDLKRYGFKYVVLEVMNPPAWWSSADEYEKVESIAAMLVKTKNDEKIMVDYVLFQSATPSLVKKAGQRFVALGLTTKWIVGGMNENSVATYVKPFLEDTSISRYLAPMIAYRSSENPSISSLQAIAAIAEKNGKSAWNMQSNIWQNYNAKDDPDGKYYQITLWPYAWIVTNNLFKNLKYGHASGDLWVDCGFPLLADWVCTPRLSRPYFYFVFSQLSSAFSSGSVVLDATSSSSSVWSLAVNKGSYFGLLLINSSLNNQTVDVNGIPNGIYSLTLTDTLHKMSSTGSKTVTSGISNVILPPKSLTMLSSTAATEIIPPIKTAQNTRQIISIKNLADGKSCVSLLAQGTYKISIFKNNGVLVHSSRGHGPAKVYVKESFPHGVYIVKTTMNNITQSESLVR